MEYMRKLNALKARLDFYNTLTTNCATNILVATALMCVPALGTTIAQAADPSIPLPSTELRAGGAGLHASWNDSARALEIGKIAAFAKDEPKKS
jgi:hypothetical protein